MKRWHPLLIGLFLFPVFLTWKLNLRIESFTRSNLFADVLAPPVTVVLEPHGSTATPPSIAYVTSVAFCAKGKRDVARKYNYRDGPPLLAHSIRKASLRSNYTNYTIYAVVHREAYECSKQYLQNDYEILIKESPVLQEEVQTPEYRHLIKHGSGCCGVREFLKLYIYNMTQHDVVVYFDSDVLLLQPMDPLFDKLLSHESASTDSIPLMRSNATFPSSTVDAFITRDYIQGNPYTLNPDRFAFQGGFFAIKPNQTVFEEMLGIIRRGQYTDESGWAGSRIGNFYGAATIQGFLAYYYSILHPENVVELNRCRYNTMVYDEPKEACPGCEDCRTTPLDKIQSVHFTMCQKPWACRLPDFGESPKLCRDVQRVWYQQRRELEIEQGKTPPFNYSVDDHTLGYCQDGVYLPMEFSDVL